MSPMPATASTVLPGTAQDLEDVILDYLRACEAGEQPALQELLARHPQHAAELEQFLRDEALLDPLWKPLQNPTALPEAPSELPPFGNYGPGQRLGIGGPSIVYKVWDRTLKKHVALKMLRRGAQATPAELESFRREAEKQARLDHPHIVPIYQVGERDGEPFFAMKLLEKGSLAKKEN